MQNLSITSWNVQRKLNFTGRISIKKLKSHLQTFDTDIIVLQEMCDAEENLKTIPGFELYNKYIPPTNKTLDDRSLGYNFNVVISKYPILNTAEIVFPSWNNDVVLQNCTRVEIELEDKILRLYSCQFRITKIGIKTRLRQLEYILLDAKNHNGPIIICGDMNTTIPKAGWKRWIISHWHKEPKREMFWNGEFIDYDERKLFNDTVNKHNFKESLKLDTATWAPFRSKLWEMFKLKLDWFIVKNIKITKTTLNDYVSDHKSIRVECEI